MNLKHILLLLLAFGVMFAADYPDFPDKISGTDLELENSDGDIGDGSALYVTDDESTGVYIVADKKDYEDWLDDLDEMDNYGEDYEKKSEMGIDYYYICSNYYDYYSDYEACGLAFYYNGIKYMAAGYSDEMDEDELLELTMKAAKQVAGVGILGGLCSCPIGLVLIGGTLAGVSRLR